MGNLEVGWPQFGSWVCPGFRITEDLFWRPQRHHHLSFPSFSIEEFFNLSTIDTARWFFGLGVGVVICTRDIYVALLGSVFPKLWQPKMSPALPRRSKITPGWEILHSEETNCHLQWHGLISQHNGKQKQHILKLLFKNRQNETMWEVWRKSTLTEKHRGGGQGIWQATRVLLLD